MTDKQRQLITRLATDAGMDPDEALAGLYTHSDICQRIAELNALLPATREQVNMLESLLTKIVRRIESGQLTHYEAWKIIQSLTSDAK